MTPRTAYPVSVLIGFVCVSLFFQACGGGDSSTSGSQVAPTIGSITVIPSVSSIAVGQTQQYTAAVKDTNGNIMKGVTVDWSSSQPGVLTIDNNGLVQGLNPGTTIIMASQGGIQSQLVTLTVTSIPVARLASLPPWLAYCNNELCAGLAPVVAAVCPDGTPSCTPTRSTTVVPQVNGVPISGVAIPLIRNLTLNGLSFPNTLVRLISGDGAVSNGVTLFVNAYTASSVQLKSKQSFLVSYYGLPPVWGGTTAINFTTTHLTSALVDTWFYRHPSFTPDTSVDTLHARVQTIITTERDLTGITTSEHVTAYFLPTELTANRDGEGNFSYGNGTVTMHYGHPLYIERIGGIASQVLARFAHEYVHELFNEMSDMFLDNPRCLNEGLADAVAFASGFLPEPDFGPIGLRGLDFTDGCLEQTETHDIGNCYLWNLKQAGFLTPTVIRGLFHPQHTFVFDSCVMDERTGNTLLVYFTESASGANLIPALNAMRLPHAASYLEAKAALGL